MIEEHETKAQLIEELAASRQRIAELEAAAEERERAVEALRRNLARLTALIENLQMGVLVEDEARCILHANQAFCDLFGVEAPHLIVGANCGEAAQAAQVLFADPEGFMSGIEARLATQEKVLGEELTLADGQVFERDYVPVVAEEEYHGHLWLYRDITARVRAEEALRESEERFRELADLLPQVVYEANAEGVLTYANRVALEWFGYAERDLEMGLTASQMLAPEDRERAGRAIREILMGKQPAGGREYLAQRKDGSTFPIAIYSSPIVRQGKVAGLRGIIVDITERKRAEEVRLQLLERVQRQQSTVVDLALHEAFTAGDVDAATQVLTQAVAEAMEAERVSVWLIENEATELRCCDLYLRSAGVHQSGQVLAAADFPVYFDALKQGRAIDAHDARTDPRTSEFTETYLVPNGITSMLDATIRLHGQVVGVVCHEHVSGQREWQADEITFAGEVADQMAQVLANAERRHAQDALRVSEERYRTLVERSLQGLVIAQDNPVRLRFASKPMQAISGYAVEELESFGPQQLAGLVHPEDRESFFKNFRDRLAGEAVPARREYRVVHKDGAVRWVESYSSRIEYEGEPTTLTAFLDITERKRTEEALRRERDLSQALERAAAEISSTLDLDQVLDRVLEQVSRVIQNDAANMMLVQDGRARIARWRGYERFGTETYVSSVVFEVTKVPNLRQMMETGSPIIIPDTATHPGWVHVPEQAWLRSYVGTPIVVQGRVIGYLNVNSATPNSFTPVHADILRAFASHAALALHNARLYQERVRTQEALREMTERFQSILAYSPAIIFAYDRDGRYLFASHSFGRLFGVTPGQVAGKTFGDLFEPEVAAAFDRRRKRMLERPQTMETQVTLNIDGEVRVFSTLLFPLKDEAGRVMAVSGIATDATERERLEEQLRQAQRMEAVGRLAGGVAHDFNNNLTAIQGYAEMLLLALDPQDPRREDVQAIQHAADRSADLTRQLLAFSRKQVIQPRVLDLNSLIENMRKMLRRLIGEDIELRTALAPELGHVKADPGQIEQVVMNLVVNARDAIDEKVKSQVTPFAARLSIEMANVELDEAYAHQHVEVAPGRYVMLAVSDNGIGMDRETLSHLFEPFFTTKEPGWGTGLGLATVYGIVKQSDGYIHPYSEPGMGTTFKVYLPRVDAAAEPAVKTEATAAVAGGGETILLVEDEETVRALARRILEQRGYCVLEASNADEALRLCNRDTASIHLVLTDVVVPGLLSIKELVGQIATHRPEIKVIYMSGYTDDVIAHHGVLDPGIHFVHKPFTPNALARKVREVLDASLPGGLVEQSPADLDAQSLRAGNEVLETPVSEIAGSISLTRESLTRLPADLVAAMREATINADIDRLCELIDRVETRDAPVAAGLRALASRYQNDTLLDLFDAGEEEP